MVESANETDGVDFENQGESQNITEDNGSSNFGFDENFQDENRPNDTEETDELAKQEMFMADLAEENANSLPSVVDENSIYGQNTETQKQQTEEIKENDDVSAEKVLEEDFEMLEDTSFDTKTDDTLAQSEDIKQKDDQATDLDAENISEDELPVPTKPKVQDAEEVSDEELPGPKMAELPADTEVVSEEELPSTTTTPNSLKKDGKRKLEDYDPSDPTEENDLHEKKARKDEEGETNYFLGSDVMRISAHNFVSAYMRITKYAHICA